MLKILFADVRSVIDDKETLDAVWSDWTESEEADEEENKVQNQKNSQEPVETKSEEAEEEDENESDDWSTMDATQKLSAQDVLLMQEDFEDELFEYIEDEAQLDAIIKKWKARKDLAGKTKAAITELLFADVSSVVKDKEMLDEIQDSWKVADAITGTAPTKAQDTELDKVRKVLHAAVKNNKVKWKEAFAIFDINEKTGYDAELVAGIYLMTKNAKPEDAWIWAIQGIIAYNKINKKKTSDADIKLIRDLSEKTIVCKAPKNCAKLQTEMMEKAQYIFASKILTAISMIINSKEIQEMALGVFVRTAYKTYQDMEFYNPYEVEAACLKSGTDELSCFRMTYGGILGYALFGKQADDGVKIDQKSLDLQNRWKEEALKKFKCEDNEAKVCTRIVLKKP